MWLQFGTVLASGVHVAVWQGCEVGVGVCKDEGGLILHCLAQTGHVLGVLAYLSLRMLFPCPKLEPLK